MNRHVLIARISSFARMLAPLFDERGNIGGGRRRDRSRDIQQAQQVQTQQTAIPQPTPAEQQHTTAAQQSDLFRMFLMQKLAQEQFQQPLMTPYATEGLQILNRQFNDQQDMRGFQGSASPIENARALGTASYLNQLQNDAFQKRLALSGVLQPSAGGLGLMGLQQQRTLAGAPTTMTMANTQNATRTGTTTGGSSGFDLGSAGNFLTGIGNLYGAGQRGGLWGSQPNALSSAYAGAGYQGGTMWGY